MQEARSFINFSVGYYLIFVNLLEAAELGI